MLLPSSPAPYHTSCANEWHGAHPWSERSSTIGSITATGYWLHHRNISLPNYSPSFVLQRGWYYDYLVAHLFLPRCACNSIGWTSMRESGSRWLCWPTNPSTDWLQHIYPDTAFLFPVFRVALISGRRASGNCLCRGQKLWRSALVAFSGLSQHLEHSPCSASRFRTVSRQLQAETEIPFFYILVIVLFFSMSCFTARACVIFN